MGETIGCLAVYGIRRQVGCYLREGLQCNQPLNVEIESLKSLVMHRNQYVIHLQISFINLTGI